jgi:hypothetical protein
MDMLTNEVLSRSQQRRLAVQRGEDLPTSTSATFSLGLGDGVELCSSPAGEWISLAGLGLVHVSRLARQADMQVPPTPGTYGRSSPALFASAALQWSLESRLRARLDVNGSPEYLLTWKQWDMPQREPICALRASARRTSVNDFTGWPTPDTMSGPHGPRGVSTNPAHQSSRGLEAVAGWATPKANDSTGAQISPKMQGGMALKSQALLTAVTEKPGALNPEFVCWLMGFPPEWDACAVTAMPSSRK